MSSYPTHTENVQHAKALGLNIGDYTNQEDDFDSWDYDTLTEVCSELLNRIDAMKIYLGNNHKQELNSMFGDKL